MRAILLPTPERKLPLHSFDLIGADETDIETESGFS